MVQVGQEETVMLRWLIVVLCASILLAIFLSSGQEIITRLDEYQVARTEYAQLREELIIPAGIAVEGGGESNIEGIDFDALYAISPAGVGWITVPGTTISYPIAQGADNEWYLRHTFLGQENPSGAIFMDYRNTPDFSDPHTLVYGHNMLDDSMFAPLHSWNGEHFIIHAPDGRVLEYRVFNRQIVSATSELYALLNAATDTGERVVTLSTCIAGQAHLRFVVQGRHVGPIILDAGGT